MCRDGREVLATGPGLMPLVKTLFRAGLCDGETALVGGACGGPAHGAWVAGAAAGAALLVSCAIRLAWADFDVARLEARRGSGAALPSRVRSGAPLMASLAQGCLRGAVPARRCGRTSRTGAAMRGCRTARTNRSTP